MKKSVSGNLSMILSVALFSFIAVSCVDENYDMNKLETDAVILRGAALPVGDLNHVKISDFLHLDEDQDVMIRPDDNGDFAITFDGTKPISTDVTVPSFNISFKEGGAEERKLVLRMPSAIAGMEVGTLLNLMPEYNQPLSYEDITGKKATLNKSLVVEDDCYLPHFISGLKEVGLEAEVKYVFSLNILDKNSQSLTSYGGAMYIEEGFTIDFPDYFTSVKNDDIDGYEIVTVGDNRNVVRFKKDVKVQANKSVTFDILITKAEIPSEFVVDGTPDSEGKSRKMIQIDVNDPKNKILIEGDVYVKLNEFVKVPSVVEMNMALSFNSLDVKSAVVSLNVEETVPDQTLKVPEVPELLTRQGVVIDLYDPMMIFQISNPTPLDINISSHLHAYQNGVEITDMYLGENGENVPFTVPREFNGQLAFSRRGEGDVIAIPKLADLFRTIPDQVRISDIGITTSDNFIEIIPGQSLKCSLDYSFYAPLAFGPDLYMALDYDIADLKLALDGIMLESAVLTFDAVSTLPLALSVDAALLDKDGNVTTGTVVNIDGSILPGSIETPTSSPIQIKLTSSDSSLKLDGLRLMFEATCPEAFVGKTLNESQGLAIKNVKLQLPDGVFVDLDELMEE